jgi:pseudaminic acid synthase
LALDSPLILWLSFLEIIVESMFQIFWVLNHSNLLDSFDKAKEMVYAAKEAGADCVKLQTYTADTITIACNKEPFHIKSGTQWDGQTLHELYKTAYTPWEWQPKLKDLAESLGMDCFSSPFDDSAVDFLEKMGVDAYKIASFEVVDHLLLRKVARTGKPVVMSSGTCTLSEIEDAVNVLRDAGCKDLLLLKCTSAYPTPFNEVHLNAIPHMAATFGTFVGLSDHTPGTAVPVAAVALGACFVEKHFILDRSAGGPDADFSLEPAEFKQMVEAVRVADECMGKIKYADGKKQSASRVFRRSLFVVEDVKAGDIFTSQNVRSIRPNAGLHTRFYHNVLGRKATIDLERGTPLAHGHIGVLPKGEAQLFVATPPTDDVCHVTISLNDNISKDDATRNALISQLCALPETPMQVCVCGAGDAWQCETLKLAGYMPNPLQHKSLQLPAETQCLTRP